MFQSGLRLASLRVQVAIGLAGATVCAMVLAAIPAFAETPTPATAPTATQNQIQRLEKLFQREKEVHARQEKRLERAEDLVPKLESRIADLKAKGKDTSILEAALDGFEEAIETARGYNATAASLIAAHNGFDSEGHVTNPRDARATVTAIAKAERDFHQTARKAVAELVRAIRQFRQANQTPASGVAR